MSTKLSATRTDKRKAKHGLSPQQHIFVLAIKPLANTRHERFSQLLFEGKTADNAYATAGYKPDRHHAARLATKGNIRARVAFLQSQVAERNEITQDFLVEQTLKILEFALAPVPTKDRYGNPTGTLMRQLGAANTAIFNLAKLTGNWVDKRAEMPANLAQELFEAIGAKPMKLIEHDASDEAESVVPEANSHND